jgi:tetratricopeptide (TPR) repeat protein
MFRGGLIACGVAASVLFVAVAAEKPADEQLAEARNLGKAFYENPTTQQDAVDQFHRALELNPQSAREHVNYGLALLHAAKTADGVKELELAQKQDPSIPHTWFNLGIAYKKDAQNDKAIAQFEGMIRLVPDEPVSHYNLGVLYKLTDKNAEAIREFETSARLNPALAAPHFQLFNAYRLVGRAEDATREQAVFQNIKKLQAGAAVPEDMEWSYYAEIFDAVDAKTSEDTGLAVPLQLRATELAKGFSFENAGITQADIDGKGSPVLIAWSSSGIRVFRGNDPVQCGLDGIKDPVFVAPADFNNDGLADLAIITKTGAALWINRAGKFEKSADLKAGTFNSAVWLDFDHDYDPDLVLLGDDTVLMRNNGTAGFSDETKLFPFVKGKALAGAAFDVVPDTDGIDLVVTYADRAAVLYRDRLRGKFEAVDLPAIGAGATAVAARDLDNDGFTDLVAASGTQAYTVWNRKEKFEKGAAVTGPAFAIADLQDRGLADLVGTGSTMRNKGSASFAAAETAVTADAIALYGIDEADGSHSVASIRKDGSLQMIHSTTPSAHWIGATLTGVKNPKLAYGAKVEIRAGLLYQKRAYYGLPITFGLRGRTEVESVRITWPNGLIQNQVRQAGDKAWPVKEAQRLSGSCPMIFTWNGQSFEFLTDVLGVAPLGAASGDGSYFPVDHDEYVYIPGERMQMRNGQYEVRVTEELREVSYLDRIQLIAIDHAADTEIFTNDKFKSPPFPEFRLFGAKQRVYPAAARDSHGHDVRNALLHRDEQYAGSFARDFQGVAETHFVDLDFGHAAAANKAVLILNGWVDWADGSTFKAASQASKEGLVMPYLQVKNKRGEWQTVVEDMGIPAGKPKTIAVDLTGRFLSDSREIRIVTNLCVYWDEIFLTEDSAQPDVKLTGVDARTANLHFRGFSRPIIDSERVQPEKFLYSDVAPVSQWNPTAGNYTRFGDVSELLKAADDRMAIIGSGDEITLQFDPAGLPALKPGWRRDFMLLVDGWAKDADSNTAFGDSVEPLPFHAMSAYPYGSGERFPDDSTHEAYRRTYNTRPALRLLRPLR